MTIVGEGIILCGIKNCSGVCVDADREFYCISPLISGYCVSPRYNFIVQFGFLTCVQLLCYLATFFLSKIRISLITLITSIFKSLLITVITMCAVCLVNFNFNFMPEIGYLIPIPFSIFLFVLFNIISCTDAFTCCCEKKPEDSSIYIYNLMVTKKKSFEEAEKVLQAFSENAPELEIDGMYVSTTRTHKHTISTYRNFVEYIPYTSWKDEGEINPEIPPNKICLINLDSHFGLSQNLENMVAQRHRDLVVFGKEHFSSTIIYYVPHPSGAGGSIIAVPDDACCCVTFYESCFGKFLYFILRLCGLHMILETQFLLSLKSVRISRYARVSDTNEYENQAYTTKGGQTNNPPVSIYPPDISIPPINFGPGALT